MHQIDWYANDGRMNPAPDTVETAMCGVCGTQMNVKLDVLGATSSAEAIGGGKHRHDSFTCPNIDESWHKRISRLKRDVYIAEIDGDVNYGAMKKTAEREIIEILDVHVVR